MVTHDLLNLVINFVYKYFYLQYTKIVKKTISYPPKERGERWNLRDFFSE